MNCVAVVQFSCQYILLLLNWLLLKWIVWLSEFSSNYIFYCSTDWCYRELCDCYWVHFSIYIVISQVIRVIGIMWLLLSLVLNTYCYYSTDWRHSELFDCYWVQFTIYTVIADLICVRVNCVTVIKFSSQYILLFLN